MAEVKLHDSWKSLIGSEFEQDYFTQLKLFVKGEYQKNLAYPPSGSIFRALDACPPESVKVVILGQDPYHGPGQANGLCFSVNTGMANPPSLVNIFKEISQDLKQPIRTNGDLQDWAAQGVLLLNATLTVRRSEAGSHQNKGWETFTDAVIMALAKHQAGIVYLLWGSYAQKKAALVNTERNLVLKAPHPSPLSAHRGFLGCKHFSKANDYLIKNGKEPINW